MSTLDRRFNKLAKDQRPKYPPPFSLRLTFEERAKLDMLRGSMPLGRYTPAKRCCGKLRAAKLRRKARCHDAARREKRAGPAASLEL